MKNNFIKKIAVLLLLSTLFVCVCGCASSAEKAKEEAFSALLSVYDLEEKIAVDIVNEAEVAESENCSIIDAVAAIQLPEKDFYSGICKIRKGIPTLAEFESTDEETEAVAMFLLSKIQLDSAKLQVINAMFVLAGYIENGSFAEAKGKLGDAESKIQKYLSMDPSSELAANMKDCFDSTKAFYEKADTAMDDYNLDFLGDYISAADSMKLIQSQY